MKLLSDLSFYKIIFYVIIILLVAFLLVIFIIIRSSTKVYHNYQSHKKLLAEQHELVKCLQIKHLEQPVKYYLKEYQYQIQFENVFNHQIIDLYVQEYDALLLEINEEYNIIHEGLVLFSFNHKHII